MALSETRRRAFTVWGTSPSDPARKAHVSGRCGSERSAIISATAHDDGEMARCKGFFASNCHGELDARAAGVPGLRGPVAQFEIRRTSMRATIDDSCGVGLWG